MEGNGLVMPWKQISADEYSRLVENAAREGDAGACLLTAMRLIDKGLVDQAGPFLDKAGPYRDQFPGCQARIQAVLDARKAREQAKLDEDARLKEEARRLAEEARKAKMGPTLITDSGEVQMFPLEHPLNQDISDLPVHERSDEYIGTMGLDMKVYVDLSIPFCIVGGDQPTVPVEIVYPSESDPGPYPIPDNAPVEPGPLSGPGLEPWQREGEGYRHILVLDKDHQKLYEFFHCFRLATGWKVDNVAVFDLTTYKLRPRSWSSADAAGLPILPTLVRYDEVIEKGEIKHALRFAVPRTQRGYIVPATHQAGESTDPSLPPMGLRMRLKSDYPLTGLPKPVVVILTAMKKYGVILADNGRGFFITGEVHPKLTQMMVRPIMQVTVSDLEAVYTGEIQH